MNDGTVGREKLIQTDDQMECVAWMVKSSRRWLTLDGNNVGTVVG